MQNPRIPQHSHRQLHTFLDELKNETRTYQTVSSLGQQVAQEYRGRCVIELMQNAHDALRDAPEEDPRSISFVVRTTPTPVLLVANSGIPFREEDFAGISQLGQSPKDPNRSVGNKGLGFRSVLEICTCPEIWSSAASEGHLPFRFGFNPAVLDIIAGALDDLQRRGTEARSPFVSELQLVDWSQETIERFVARFADGKSQTTQEVRKYLSTYQFPLELGEMPEEVRALLYVGHQTVIRLPIDGGRDGNAVQATKSVISQFEEIDSYAMIFLSYVRKLAIDIDGVVRTFTRSLPVSRASHEQQTSYEQIAIDERTAILPATPSKVFNVWQQTIGGAEDPTGHDDIRDAVRHLPNRWPDVRSATIGLATEEADDRAQERFVIFLPTTVGTGTFINAPFFGTLDRRAINFDDHYNKLLWVRITQLCLRVIRELASQLTPEKRAQTIIDIVGSTSPVVGLGRRVLDDLVRRSADEKRPLVEEEILLCDQGWAAPSAARRACNVFSSGPIAHSGSRLA